MNKLILTLIIFFTTTQTLATDDQLIDQIAIGPDLYDVILDEVENVDTTTKLQASVNRKGGNLVAQMSIYNTKKSDITPAEEFKLYIISVRICDEYGENSTSLMNPKGSGYLIDELPLATAGEGTLSEDQKYYHFTCEVLYYLKKS